MKHNPTGDYYAMKVLIKEKIIKMRQVVSLELSAVKKSSDRKKRLPESSHTEITAMIQLGQDSGVRTPDFPDKQLFLCVTFSQVDHTLAEKRILFSINFPFLVRLRFHFKDNSNLYLVLDFEQGGEMFTHLRKQKKFSEVQARFYCAQVGECFNSTRINIKQGCTRFLYWMACALCSSVQAGTLLFQTMRQLASWLFV